MNISALVLFFCLHTWWRLNRFIFSWIGKHSIDQFNIQLPAIDQVRDVSRALQTCTMDLFAKMVCKVNLKTLTIATKSSTLDAWMGQNVPLQTYYTSTKQFLKFKRRYLPYSKENIESFNQLSPFWSLG